MNYKLDIECYINYFLINCTSSEGFVWQFEKVNDVITIDELPNVDFIDGTFITFNGLGYDLIMLGGLKKGFTNTQLKMLSDEIILSGKPHWEIVSQFELELPRFDHIDIAQVLPLMASLKVYGARIGVKKLQDLPIEPDAIIRGDEPDELQKYCANDCSVTGELYEAVKPQIELRERMSAEYGTDLRSKSDAQIAETVISSEYTKITGKQLVKPGITEREYKYKPPSFVSFGTVQLNELLDEIKADTFKIKMSNGRVDEPKSMKNRIVPFADVNYKLGLGGLHSVDKPASFYSDDDHVIFDIDVAAYYPNIILNAKFYPEHIGPEFLDIYRKIVETRIAAKKSGDKVTDASLKITINGTFGKLGSMYSKIYSPDLMFHVTVTGQLCLLMLIERLENMAISANTDGIMVKVPRNRLKDVEKVVRDWERGTGFDMEWNEYTSVHRRDVNNYIAITPDGDIKRKGVFTKPDLSKNPSNAIIYEAVALFFKDGVAIEDTITNCTDIGMFLTLRTVKGGAVWGGELLGKSVRWYHSTASVNKIEYRTNGNKVPLSDDCIVLQDLPDHFPWDVDYQWYIDEANKLKDMMK